MTRHFAATLAVLGLTALAVGCGVPTGDDTFEAVPSDEIPFGLDATSTTTSTTTTTTTTIPDAPETTTAPSTTTPIRLEPIELYFLSRGRLQPVPFELPSGFSADQVADVLEAGPPEGLALDTLVEDGLIVSSQESRGVLAVDLDDVVFDRIDTTEQTEAIGQIVLTMISSLRRVGQVTFTLGGEPIPVKKGNGLSSDVGEPLSYDDYAMLLATPRLAPEPATVTDPAATPTTTS